jgi:hypothetical protein
MWILQFLPNWLFFALFAISCITFLAVKFVKFISHGELVQAGSIAAALFAVFMIGAISNNDTWLARVKDLEVKVAQAEAQSATVNTDIVEKTVVKTQIVRERGKDIVRYVDREVVKYDANCVIPQEFVTAHNRAAEAPKK